MQGSTRPSPKGTISYSDLSQYDVTDDGWEVIRTTLFDSQAYPAAGSTQIQFFQKGQAGGETASQTNLTNAGMLPVDQEYLVESIDVAFYPTVPAVGADNPGAFGAPAKPNIVNDVYIFRRTGWLQFSIASKDYVFDGPLSKFPPKQHFEIKGFASDSTSAASAQNVRAAFADVTGRPYMLKPYALCLRSMQAFKVFLNYPEGVQAITNPALIVVSLDGLLFRRRQ
jgi:hypothetical protein